MVRHLLMVCVAVIFSISTIQAGEYTIGVEDLDYMPYYSVENNTYTGFARELLDAFAEKNGHTFIYKPASVNRLFQLLISKKVDFKFPDNPYWQSELKKGKNVIYSDSVVKTVEGVMLLPENKGKGTGAIKKLGTVMGFTPWPYKGMIDSGEMALAENANFDSLLKQVSMKRIDGAYINPVVASYRFKNSSDTSGKLEFDDSLPVAKNDYYLSTVKHSDVVDAFNRFLAENKAMVKKLKEKYGIVEGM